MNHPLSPLEVQSDEEKKAATGGESRAWQFVEPSYLNVLSRRGDGSTQPARTSPRRVASPPCLSFDPRRRRSDAMRPSSPAINPIRIQGAHGTRGESSLGNITPRRGVTLLHDRRHTNVARARDRGRPPPRMPAVPQKCEGDGGGGTSGGEKKRKIHGERWDGDDGGMGTGGEKEIERDRERGRENRAARVVVGRAGGRRDTPRRTGNEGRNVVAVATPSCAVGRPRRAPTSRDAASGLRAVAPAYGAIGVTCTPAQAARPRVQREARRRGGCTARALQFPIHTPRSPAFRSAAPRDVSIIDSSTLRYSIFRFYHGELRSRFSGDD